MEHHGANMRTTVTLDPEVNRLIQEAMRRERKNFKQTINDAIRRGLSPERVRRDREAFRVPVHHARLAPGINRGAFNRLAAELDDEGIHNRFGRPRTLGERRG